ncbi:hypothetical protein FKP32DRAFT_1283401 [Trametes sanguinea]|nr:hypothetical protein FKP32DRAFT_1283401 [Trametes sanguinea]
MHLCWSHVQQPRALQDGVSSTPLADALQKAARTNTTLARAGYRLAIARRQERPRRVVPDPTPLARGREISMLARLARNGDFLHGAPLEREGRPSRARGTEARERGPIDRNACAATALRGEETLRSTEGPERRIRAAGSLDMDLTCAWRAGRANGRAAVASAGVLESFQPGRRKSA